MMPRMSGISVDRSSVVDLMSLQFLGGTDGGDPGWIDFELQALRSRVCFAS